MLLAFEAEASLAAPTKRQVECLDRARRRSRYIDRNLGASDQDDDSDKDGVLSVAEEEARVAELLKVHAKRKKIRKKLRATPEVRIPAPTVKNISQEPYCIGPAFRIRSTTKRTVTASPTTPL